MLSLTSGTLLAEARNKDNQPLQDIFIKDVDLRDEDSQAQPEISCDHQDALLPESFWKNMRRASTHDKELLKQAIRQKQPSLLYGKPTLMQGYEQGMELLNKDLLYKNCQIMQRHKNYLIVVPDRPSVRVATLGPSGVGKSFWNGKYLMGYARKWKEHGREWVKEWRKRVGYAEPELPATPGSIFVFSVFDRDEAYKDIPLLQYAKVDMSIIKNPLDFKEFANSCVLFDDIESIKNPHIVKALQAFRDQCLEAGRKWNVSVIVVSHITRDREKTKRILNECDEVTMFPSGNWAAIQDLCKFQYGFDKDTIQWVKDVKSRSVTVKRTYPVAIVSETSIKLL